jgi:hypothetical protein
MSTYKDYFLSRFPKLGAGDVLWQVYSGYRNNWKSLKAQQLQSGPHRNVFPYGLNAHIDNNLLALNNKYEGLVATSEVNKARNWRYTLISYENIRLTASNVDSPETSPRDSSFRNDLAHCQFRWDIANNGDLEPCELIEMGDKIIYGLIIHSPASDNPVIPAFIHIAFPNEDCSGYLDRIDLFSEYPDLVESLRSEDMEKIPDRSEVKLHAQGGLL